ncbi:MAG: DUF3093 domain-containing protein [Brachybacterium sp.]|uniref:DUF3093 domain-containing protein n=1 Tax=Brachybacterium sp. Z12 TaxID=2759167 RepID=UPI00185FC2C2|nr:DUF3093 domain-containing protein [Brachybacterium sp. Z12]QNN83375.1 DUF3093 domain-containing protein [Brachybacterium sp. Z12]
MSAAADHTADSPSSTAPGSSPAREPAQGTSLFREHLFPGIGWWLVAVSVGAALGLVLVPLDLTVAIVVAVVCVIALVALVYQYSPLLEVKNGQFQLGRARIDVDLLGEVTVLHGEEWARTVGQDFEPLAHHCVRGWTRSGLRVEVLDDADPTTAWVASSRRPDDLALALRTAKQLQERQGR